MTLFDDVIMHAMALHLYTLTGPGLLEVGVAVGVAVAACTRWLMGADVSTNVSVT